MCSMCLASVGVFHPYRHHMHCNRACNHALVPHLLLLPARERPLMLDHLNHIFQPALAIVGLLGSTVQSVGGHGAASIRYRHLWKSYHLTPRQPSRMQRTFMYRILAARMLGQTSGSLRQWRWKQSRRLTFAQGRLGARR
jgi:hypothetical protein